MLTYVCLMLIGAPTEAFLQNKRILQDLFIDYAFLREEQDWWLLHSMSLRVGQSSRCDYHVSFPVESFKTCIC